MPHILYVDDSCDLLDILAHIFEPYDITCSSCNLNAVFGVIKVSVPDLVIINVKIYGNDGRALCRTLKTTRELNHVPVIFMSTDSSYLVNYRKFLADDIIEMPFEIEDLLKKVDALLAPVN